MFSIKIKIKGYLENTTENEKIEIDTTGIKNKNIIKYKHEDTTNKIVIEKDKITITRENENASYQMLFKENKQTKIEYYIKEYNTTVEMHIETTKLIYKDEYIQIDYKIIESGEEYTYKIEMSE